MRMQLCGRPAGATSRHLSFPHKAQGRGFELGPMEVLGTQEGLGSQWCNRLPHLLPKNMGEKGVVVGICVFRLLPDTLTFEVQHLPTNKRTDR
jgi:hypothetical protein